jgi:hypothetical protein
MARTSIIYVDPAVLERVESKLAVVLAQTHASAILLIDRSGLVLANAGDPPMHPDELGAVAAGTFQSMSSMIRASRAEEFIVRIPDNNANLQFCDVDKRVFLMAFYSDSRYEQAVREGLSDLANAARNSLTEEQTADRRMDNVSFIEQKLSQIFDK